jgi:hypothetical protein
MQLGKLDGLPLDQSLTCKTDLNRPLMDQWVKRNKQNCEFAEEHYRREYGGFRAAHRRALEKPAGE